MHIGGRNVRYGGKADIGLAPESGHCGGVAERFRKTLRGGGGMRRFAYGTFVLIGVVGVAIGLYYANLVNGWGGHRPLTPDALHPYAYISHGVFYVSASDLTLSRILLFSSWALAAVGMAGSWIVKRSER
jgi:hypothetical protein